MAKLASRPVVDGLFTQSAFKNRRKIRSRRSNEAESFLLPKFVPFREGEAPPKDSRTIIALNEW